MVARVDPLGCKWLRVHIRYMDHTVGLVIYMHAFDTVIDKVTWQPYSKDVLLHLPEICSEDLDEWIVIALLNALSWWSGIFLIGSLDSLVGILRFLHYATRILICTPLTVGVVRLTMRRCMQYPLKSGRTGRKL
ncbi:hypothetical protein RND81_07G160400 [Saponaria officinalis]|uniref:Uncharacterized protein n=1 Tax=Saponaria officinalis TaxID=3572 RepID=A0AAW1JQX9_SAPOF